MAEGMTLDNLREMQKMLSAVEDSADKNFCYRLVETVIDGGNTDSDFVGNVILKGDVKPALEKFLHSKEITDAEYSASSKGVVMKLLKRHCVPAIEYAIEFLRANKISVDFPVPTEKELRQLFKPSDETIQIRRKNLANLASSINRNHKDNLREVRRMLVYAGFLLHNFTQKFCYDWATKNKCLNDFNRLFGYLKVEYVLSDCDAPFDAEFISRAEKFAVNNIKKFYPNEIPREDWARDYFAEPKVTPFGVIYEYPAAGNWKDDLSQGLISEIGTAILLRYSSLAEFRRVNSSVYRLKIYRRKSDNKIYFAYSAVKQIRQIIFDEEKISVIEKSEFELHKDVIKIFSAEDFTFVYDADNQKFVDATKLETPEVESYTQAEIATCLKILVGELHYEGAQINGR